MHWVRAANRMQAPNHFYPRAIQVLSTSMVGVVGLWGWLLHKLKGESDSVRAWCVFRGWSVDHFS